MLSKKEATIPTEPRKYTAGNLKRPGNKPTYQDSAKDYLPNPQLFLDIFGLWELSSPARQSRDRRNPPQVKNVKIFNKPVPFVQEYKYLGLTLDRKLFYKNHIKNVIEKANKATNTIPHLLNTTSNLSIKVKTLTLHFNYKTHLTLCGTSLDTNGNETLSNLSDEERCARISRLLMKKDIAQSLLDTFNDATFGHALDEDDCINLKALEQNLINALRELQFNPGPENCKHPSRPSSSLTRDRRRHRQTRCAASETSKTPEETTQIMNAATERRNSQQQITNNSQTATKTLAQSRKILQRLVWNQNNISFKPTAPPVQKNNTLKNKNETRTQPLPRRVSNNSTYADIIAGRASPTSAAHRRKETLRLANRLSSYLKCYLHSLQPGQTTNISNFTLYKMTELPQLLRVLGGGTCIYVKKALVYYQIPTPELELTETKIINLNIGNNKHITLVSIYCKTQQRFNTTDLNKLLNINHNVIIAGHFNATYSDRNNVKNNHRELNSDHLPIIFDLEMSKPPHTAPYNFHTNWHDYNYPLQNTDLNPFTIDSKESADRAINNLTNAMRAAYDKASKAKHFHSNIKFPSEI
ncbi:hypothetical protein CEXT_425351 [Caerostris extrusa]|uniref:Endonuclease/exonuclease/phosphatase domain-containing protein n=1 Tax=Caerostris extrusa TaxID=172846 RepID=A0AAV4UXR5_CAEEX|nr:hypothetical protein CEXT_425351 [Caerostris extrusa]